MEEGPNVEGRREEGGGGEGQHEEEEKVEKSPIKVLYMHGGGANPATSYKAQYLMKRFDCACPHMQNTSLYDRCRLLQCTTLREFQPDVCVGTSLGGALLLELLRLRIWRGPAVLMCPAVLLSLDDISLPSDVSIILAHGTEDRVVSIDVSREIAKVNKNSNLEFIEVDGDGHNMESVTQTDQLKTWVEEVFQRQNLLEGYDHSKRVNKEAINDIVRKEKKNTEKNAPGKKCSMQ